MTAILVTGATGFLGGPLCLRLLRTTPATLVCMARGRTDRGARDRLHAYLHRLDNSFDAARLEVVRGNLTQPRMGLPAALYMHLARSIEAVYHCAATVNLAAGYDNLVPGNITATENVIRFARDGRPKTLHHVSTMAIFSNARLLSYPVVTEETQPAFDMCGAIGYAKTKFRGEELVGKAAADGLPTVVYRPGLILGDSRTGEYSDTELSVRLIRAAVAVGCAPATPAAVPAAPVDHVANAIAALSLRPSSIGGVFHPNLLEPYPVRSVLENVRACGYDLPEVDITSWRRELLRHMGSPAVTLTLACWEAMSYMVVPEPRYLPPYVGAELTHAALADSGLATPRVTTPMFARILDRLVADGLIPPI